MTEKDHRIDVLLEEASEIVKIGSDIIKTCSKSLRFGELDINPETMRTNIEQLGLEADDLIACLEMVKEVAPELSFMDRERIEAKKKKFKKWLEHSLQNGRLD